MKTIKIGFDLDGVLVDKPPFIPRRLLQLLYKGGRERLTYRCPAGRNARRLRIWSHSSWLRPSLRENVKYLHQLSCKKGTELYLISSRYSFLEEATLRLLEKRGLVTIFRKIILNEKDEPPHLFKERVLRELRISRYFEDDEEVISYLHLRLPEVEICAVRPDRPCRESAREK